MMSVLSVAEITNRKLTLPWPAPCIRYLCHNVKVAIGNQDRYFDQVIFGQIKTCHLSQENGVNGWEPIVTLNPNCAYLAVDPYEWFIDHSW